MGDSPNMSGIPDDPRALIEMSARLKSLARALVPDEPAADDLVQEAWLAALQAPKERARDLGKWLRGVLRHRARGDRRRAQVRGDHELVAARPAWMESDEGLIERLSTAELLVAAVDGLELPYGRVLRLRFFEERSVAETARLMEAPEGTIKVWTRRGLERLREQLDRRSAGDRGVWAAAVLRFSRAEPEAPGVVIAGRGVLAWVAALLVLGSIVGLALLARRAAPDPGIATLPVASEPAGIAEAAPQAGDASDSRARVEAPVVETPSFPPVVVQARVLDEAGRPVVGAEVVAGNTRARRIVVVITDAEGRATIEIEPRHTYRNPVFGAHGTLIELEAAAPGRARSMRYYVRVDPPPEEVVELRLAGAAYAFEGRLVDADGEPVAGARVSGQVEVPDVNRISEHVLAQFREADGISDPDGRFTFEHLARTTLRYQIRADGFLPRHFQLGLAPDEERVEREVVLDRGRTLVGTLRDEDGAPVGGATLRVPYYGIPYAAEARAVADEHGRYRMSALPHAPCIVFAADPEHAQRGAQSFLPSGTEAELVWDGVLGVRPPLALRVVDEAGAPVPARIVFLSGSMTEWAWSELGLTDAEGRVRLREVPDLPIHVEVGSRNFAADGVGELRVDGLRASFEEQVLQLSGRSELARASLSASFSVEGARLIAFSVEHTFQRSATANRGTGLARLDGLAPQLYLLHASFPGRGLVPLGELELGPHDELDLGPIESPAMVEVTLLPVPADSGVDEVAELSAIYEVGGIQAEVRVGEVRVHERRVLELLPGSYRLRLVRAHGDVRALFELWPGEPLELDLRVPLAEAGDW